MADAIQERSAPTADELALMHSVYCEGGVNRKKAPHIVYSDAGCPHSGCGQKLQAVDFRLEEYGPAVHDPLVRAWWNDTGFAGRCPQCQGWIHFTIRGKRSLSADEAAGLPKLLDDWYATAIIV